jgi:penicillin-binding protein 1A
LEQFQENIKRALQALLAFLQTYIWNPLKNLFVLPQKGTDGQYSGGGYLGRKWHLFSNYNWKEARLADFAFLLKGAAAAIVLFIAGIAVFYMAVYIGLFGAIPSEQALKAHQNNVASEVYSADSILLGRYFIQDRTNVEYRHISQDAIKALIATEDSRFYQHSGIDYRSLGRVLFKTLLMQEESSGGGSTLSQQLAKNLYPRRRYRLGSTPINKVREMIVAQRLERIYIKEEILEFYLNTVPLGGDLFGIERASQRFFNATASGIKVEEAAVLIGMLKATTTYNPRLDPERSRTRRNVVLNQMAKAGFLNTAEADSLKQLPLELRYNYQTHNDGLAPYFREQLRLELVKWCASQTKEDGTPYNLYTDGLKIYTTLHTGLQAHAEQAVKKRMSALQKTFDEHWKGQAPWGKDASVVQTAMERSPRYIQLKRAGKSDEEIKEAFKQPVSMQVFSWAGNTNKEMSPMDSVRYYQRFLNTGLVSIEPRTGYVRAWVGGIDHKAFKYDHVRSRRQVGSTFKPIVYAAALEEGIEPCTYFPNDQLTYTEYQNWSPKNANGQYGGEYSMQGALAQSVNTVSAQVIMQAGVDETVELAQRMGIQGNLPKVPALALGVADLSLYEMVSAYASFANNGQRVKPVYITSIVDNKGKVLRRHQHESGEPAMSPDNAATMLRLMQGVVEDGSGRRLRYEWGLTMDIAGKTGTTQNHSDGWFIGITPDLVTGVWVGAESPKVRFRTLALGQGANTALPIWGDYMLRVSKDSQFRNYRNSTFEPLPYHLAERLNCVPFIEERVPEEENFFDRLFGRKTEEERVEQQQARQRELSARDKERERRNAERQRKRNERARENRNKKEGGLLRKLRDRW